MVLMDLVVNLHHAPITIFTWVVIFYHNFHKIPLPFFILVWTFGHLLFELDKSRTFMSRNAMSSAPMFACYASQPCSAASTNYSFSLHFGFIFYHNFHKIPLPFFILVWTFGHLLFELDKSRTFMSRNAMSSAPMFACYASRPCSAASTNFSFSLHFGFIFFHTGCSHFATDFM